jgi:hypothetical protein
VIDLILKSLASETSRRKGGQVGISGAVLLGLWFLWSTSRDVADVRERVTRIEARLNIPATTAKAHTNGWLKPLGVSAKEIP